MSTIMPNPRASIAEKKDKKWYIPMADFVIDLAISSCDKSMTRECLNAANGILDIKDYEYVMKTYITGAEATEVELALNAAKLGTLRDIDILTPIKDKYMGEFINSYHNYQVYSLDPEIVFKRNSVIGEQVLSKMFMKLQQLMSQQQEGAEPIDIKAFITKSLEEWKDEMIVKEQDTLEMLNQEIEAKRKYIDAYFYWWACEEVYTYRRIVGNDVKFEVVDPLEYYRVDSGNYFVEDDNYGLRRYTMTLHDIIDTFYNKMDDGLTEEQMKVIKKLCDESVNGIANLTPVIFLENRSAFPEAMTVGASSKVTKQGLSCIVDHYVFKTEVKKGILTYMSANGEPAEMEVGEDYKMNYKEGDLDIEWLYINQFYEGWRFGDRSLQIYIPSRPVELQRELVSNSSVCKNPYNGISYIHKASTRKPIAYRIKSNIALYKIYTLLEERWLNKFKSWMLMPESILSDSDEYTAEERLQQADVDATLPFNDGNLRENPNAISYFREVATNAVISYVKILNEVKQSIKADAWELANMNDSRFGSGSGPKGKAVTEYDYNQAIKGTVWSLEMFNSFREKDYMANLDHSRAAWIDGKQSSYVDDATKEVKMVDVDGMAHLGANVGIFIANSAELNAQAESLKQLAFSAGQNNDPAMAAEAITNKNIAKLKLLITKSTEANRAFQLQMSTAKEEAMARANQITLQDNQEARAQDMQKHTEVLDSNWDIAILESETNLEINRAKLEVDTNGNGYIDESEAAASSNPFALAAKERATAILNERKQALNEMKVGASNIKAKKQEELRVAKAAKAKTK